RAESDRSLREAAEQELSLQVKINSLQESLNRETARIEQTRKDRTLAEREFKTFSEALEKEMAKLRQQDEQAKARMQEVEQRLLKLTAEAEKAETQRQRIAAEVESLQDRREEFAQAEAQLKKWNEIEKRLRGQLEELEEKHDMLRRGLPTEEATVVMFANDIIKRIDLIDALIQRYGTVNGSDAHDQLQTLRASFEDILHQHGIVEFDVPSGTEVDVDLRKRIAVVDSVPGKAKPRVTESFRSGFIYSREDGHEIILRKVEVRTSSQ
ncbi:MAG: nucleotide exchange factor GrpE, partial [Verrucomicrobiales bacterium]|nr:nucleotide exchange factor GrpE [Verrucomicrobiales bacterium]